MSIRRIVVGADGSPGGRRAVEWTAELAAGLGAEVVVVHAYSPLAELEHATPPVDFHDLYVEAQRRLDEEWCEPLAAAGVTHRGMLVEDEPVPALRLAADEVDADLIVVGSHGHTGWRDRLLGSVARDLPQRAGHPVTIVPPPATRG